MQQIINFILRNKSFLLFVLLFGISIVITIQSHSYHKSKFINSANFVSGNVYETTHGITQYFDLKEQNKFLSEENKRLKELLYNSKRNPEDSTLFDSVSFSTGFSFTKATVIKNSYSSINNYLTLNKGEKNNIAEDYGVISSNGIVGIIDNTSTNFSRVLSVLNSKSRINAQHEISNHYGTLKWDGKSPQIVQLVDIPKQAPINQGDTITTGGNSTIFPKGIPIGYITSFKLDETENYYIVQVQLFNDMSNLGYVYIIENKNANEINSLDIKDE